MSRVKSVSDAEGRHIGWMIFCPGCKEHHQLRVGTWNFNGDLERPTFSPSLLVTIGHYTSRHRSGPCWCDYNREHPDDPSPFKCGRCHSFIRDGRIEFLGDCTHELRSQTVDLPPVHEE